MQEKLHFYSFKFLHLYYIINNFYVLLVVSFINIFTRPHRVSRLTFLFYLFDLLCKVTGIFWTFACYVALSPYTTLLSTSCSSSQDFIPYFLHFHFTMDNLYFLNGSLTPMPIVNFHHLAKRHACRTKKKTENILKCSPSFNNL